MSESDQQRALSPDDALPLGLDELICAYGNATFDCGEWVEDDPVGYKPINEIAIKAKLALVEGIKSALASRPTRSAGGLPEPSGVYNWIDSAVEVLRSATVAQGVPGSSLGMEIDTLLSGVPTRPLDLGFGSPADVTAALRNLLTRGANGWVLNPGWQDVVKAMQEAVRIIEGTTRSASEPFIEPALEGAAILLQVAEMEEHNEAIFKGKWKKGSKGWSGDFIVRLRAEGMAKIRGAMKARTGPLGMRVCEPACHSAAACLHPNACKANMRWENERKDKAINSPTDRNVDHG